MHWMRFASLFLCILFGTAWAQEYPSKPIRILVGYSAGGGNDIIVRVMAPELSKGLGQPVVVENKPGAQSIIAAELAAKSAPDGYTIFMGPSGPMTINPATYTTLPYDAQRDFAPISMICAFPLIVVVDPKLGINSMKELVAYAKKNPGKANYASSAGVFQVTTELFKQKTGANFQLIPYKGSGDSIKAVISGEVTMTIIDPAPASGPIKAGTVKALAVTTEKRHPSWPDVPTMAEAGIADMVVPVWTAFFAPAGTPQPIIARWQKEVARVVHTAEVRERFATMGLEPVGGTPQELAKAVARDLERYKAAAKAANIKNN
jgi:tripartite-type tricarboxylate transporter receptor subunit TctC